MLYFNMSLSTPAPTVAANSATFTLARRFIYSEWLFTLAKPRSSASPPQRVKGYTSYTALGASTGKMRFSHSDKSSSIPSALFTPAKPR